MGRWQPRNNCWQSHISNAHLYERLHRIRELLADGLNLAGIARVLELEHTVARLRAENSRLRER